MKFNKLVAFFIVMMAQLRYAKKITIYSDNDKQPIAFANILLNTQVITTDINGVASFKKYSNEKYTLHSHYESENSLNASS